MGVVAAAGVRFVQEDTAGRNTNDQLVAVVDVRILTVTKGRVVDRRGRRRRINRVFGLIVDEFGIKRCSWAARLLVVVVCNGHVAVCSVCERWYGMGIFCEL